MVMAARGVAHLIGLLERTSPQREPCCWSTYDPEILSSLGEV